MASSTKSDRPDFIGEKGEFVRKESSFRSWVTADGSSGFPAEAGRYHLYVSDTCPWAHRALITRKIKGLEDAISVDFLDWLPEVSVLEKRSGWKFNPEREGCTPDTVNGKQSLREVYQIVEPGYSGRCTVPVLWDKKTNKLVNNESAEIMRMLHKEFNPFCKTEEQRKIDLYPEHLQKEIDAVNEWVYTDINNGVYRSGFATKQEAYDTAVRNLFKALDRLEEILSKTRYVTGDQLTEADLRLFTTLIRFDPVYVGHFKCNKKRLVDYPNLWGFTREVYQMPGVRETVNMDHTTKHYMIGQTNINPTSIVSIGPDINYDEPHGREKLTSKV